MYEIGEDPKHFYQPTKLNLCKDANGLTYKGDRICRIDSWCGEFVRQYCLFSMRLGKCGPRERQLYEIGEDPESPFPVKKWFESIKPSSQTINLRSFQTLKNKRSLKFTAEKPIRE